MNPASPGCRGFILPFSKASMDMLGAVGGKNASLGEMIRTLAGTGVRVPDGFALTTDAFRLHLEQNGLAAGIYEALDRLDTRDVQSLAETGRKIRGQVAGAPLPAAVAGEARKAYLALSQQYGEDGTDVAVRSSATAEDLPTASFAGQHETFLNVRGWEALDRAIRSCMASLFTDRAIVYRARNGIPHRGVALSVGVQKMVRSDLAGAGVIFTLDTESGFPDVVLVTAAYGLGETVVQGRVNPDECWVHKPTLRQGFRPILRRELGQKAAKLVYGTEGEPQLVEKPVSEADRGRYVLSDEEILALAGWALKIEEHYSARAGRPTPMDIEWAKDGRSGSLFIVQARPETVHTQMGPPRLETYRLRGKGRILARGKSVGERIGTGSVRRIRNVEDLKTFRKGEVLVAPMTDPDWEPVLRQASAVVTDQGGRTCHAAIVSREIGLPCVVGTMDGTKVLADGQEVTVSCAGGDEGRVFEGRLPFDREEVDLGSLPPSPVPLMLNVANPDQAFHLAQLPCAGVGLMRIEFLVSSWVGVHPMALVHPERVKDLKTSREIHAKTAAYAAPSQFFVERLASGIAQIAAAFYPRPVIVRFSDFKTNEYAGLLGGAAFEPAEENPMIGFRGASRYYDERYREGFALECQAIRQVRGVMGLKNVKVMIPFCRTLTEGKAVLEEMAKNGLPRGGDGLEVYVMCEIPNNVILAEGFSDLFDGFSIGSNDLTQLTLGVDRDSGLLSHIFDERDPGVKRMIAMVVEAAHRKGRPVGICGQAPSDFPDYAEFLVGVGIDSISLNPDAIIPVTRRLAGSPARSHASC